MTENEKLATTFYSAFQKRDFAQMQSCYHKDATFKDPAFGPLNYLQAKAMWHMLCKRANDLSISFSILSSTHETVRVKWIANYTYTASNSKVKNEITATLTVKDGKIYTHVDEFSFWKWSRQALGFTGLYLGWTPLFRKVVRKTALKSLSAFIAKHPEYQ
ncbi:nuclear transport factor 2 family protein [bacterium]|nr:MAG: nuclear transport factor 2 family protein [bacterium]